MTKKEQIIVGISVGDLNGIGAEIILKSFLDARMLEFCTPVIFASVKLMSFYKKHFELQMNLHGINHLGQIAHKKINVLNLWKEGVNVEFGQEHPQAGAYAIKSFKAAVEALKKDDIDVLVTAPIHKYNIQADDFKFPGHTDYLNQELEGDSMMFMISENLRVGLLTDHLPVSEVSAAITQELIETKIKTVTNTLKQDFGIITPKIAVLGINPHTGDNGVIGKEDDEVVRPTLAKLNEEGTLVYGPYAADSFFGSKNHQNFDAIIAAYHDQGLVPFKTLSFGKGVNYTAGLEKIRTSPDHGTAYDIAGKNTADFQSFKEAVFSAIQIFKTRREYSRLSANPLQKRARKVLAKKR